MNKNCSAFCVTSGHNQSILLGMYDHLLFELRYRKRAENGTVAAAVRYIAKALLLGGNLRLTRINHSGMAGWRISAHDSNRAAHF